MTAWAQWADQAGTAIDDAGRWRTVRSFDAQGPEGVLVDSDHPGGRRLVSFASNDYLGLTVHPAVRAAAMAAIDRWGTGAGSARLVVGSRPVHHELETALADWRHTESALLFPTGFAANLSVMSVFGAPGVRILSDELNHASIIDGCRMAQAETVVYRHGDTDHLAELLDVARSEGIERTIVVTDTVFSMDGDVAPIETIAGLAGRHGSLLVVDEAHAVLGPFPDLSGLDALRIGTLSKTLGSLGGFVAGPKRFIELLVNMARPFIFTTGSTPADTAAALAALTVVNSTEGERLRDRLRSHIERIAPGHPSPVIPILVGDERAAVRMADRLADQGLFVPAIRPPTVPVGTSRLRVALSAAHTDAQIAALAAGLESVRTP